MAEQAHTPTVQAPKKFVNPCQWVTEDQITKSSNYISTDRKRWTTFPCK